MHRDLAAAKARPIVAASSIAARASSCRPRLAGATAASYTLTSSEEGKAIKVRVSFTDDAGNGESLTSAATDAVASPPTPLTASIHDAPGSHDGENSFTFELRFSETPEPDFSYEALRDHAFTATGGTVTNARRLDPPGNIRWEITVEPSSDAEVSIVLPETTDCDDQGAVCTEDGRMLSAEAALTVAGPEEEEEQTAPENNPATGAPAITGTAQVGETLTANTSGIADTDGLSNASFSYQWIRNDGSADTDIQDATGSTYTLTTADEGKAVKVRVSFTDDAGNAETLTSAATDAVAAAPRPNSLATGAPTITGTAQVGETLDADVSSIADEDGLEKATFAYQWLAGDADVAGATGSSYTLAEADEGKAVKVQVSFTDDRGFEDTLTSEATTAVAAESNNPATGEPTINGTVQVGETLTADTSGIADADGLDNASFSYQWLADDTDTPGANGSSYTLAEADEGKAVKVRVSFTDDAGNEETLTSAATEAVAAKPNSQATGAPTITGTAQVGETLTADTSGIADDDGLDNATFAYQWLADGAEIAGATNSTYTLANADEGKAVKVRVSFTDDAGNAETLTSAATAAVAAKPTPLTAEFLDTPGSHDGQGAFTFELRFSEEFDVSYVTLRDHAFAVTGGEVPGARRLEQGSNIRWEITVMPDSGAAVTVVLPATEDCGDQGAICTGDGRRLSNRTELTVSGPDG